MGILLSLGALLSWGIGDFLIQRSARKFGDWIALFYITAFASVFLFPFVYKDLPKLFTGGRDLVLLIALSATLLFAALFDFEALRIGKISIIEPMYAFEVPVTAILGVVVIGEFLSGWQTMLIGVLLVGIFLVSVKSFRHFKNIGVERGVWYAVWATLGMGTVNFLFGFASRVNDPLLVNWFTSCFVAIIAFAYLAAHSRIDEIARDWKNHKELIVAVSAIDNIAWIFFAYSVLYIPIAIATGISESYIALAAGLGLFFNKERLKKHQLIGIAFAVVGVIALSLVTKR